MAENKWMKTIRKSEGAVLERRNPHAHVIRSPSPSFNFIFGNAHGAPRGYSVLISGAPKGGKTLIKNAMIGQMHQDDPEGIAIDHDTEFRADGQLGENQMKVWHIDGERYQTIQTNKPKDIFDNIETGNIREALEGGAPIRIISIDSVNGIQGLRGQENTSIEDVTIGDLAMTLQKGLQRILPIQRKYGFVLLLISQARAEMDPLKVKQGRKWKPAVSWAVLHHCEYFVEMEENTTKAGRTDILGNEFINEDLQDTQGNGERTGHKIRAVMSNSSMGPKRRVAEFTLDYNRGIINVHEEVFTLGVNRGIIEKPNQQAYAFGGKTWRGKEAMLEELKTNTGLQGEIIKELRRRDLAGLIDVPVATEEVSA